MTDPDELYTLRNLFWLGSFQRAIAEGNGLSRLPDELKAERDEFVYRSYVGQGQFALVVSEVDDDAPPNLQAIKLLARYLEQPAATKDEAVETVGGWMASDAGKDATVQLVAALVYQREDLMDNAFKAILKQQTMEQKALWAQFCLQIHRIDLAEEMLKKLNEIDEDATLTQLVGAWVHLAKGGDGVKEAAYAYEELIDKFGDSLTLLNGLAVAKMHLKDYDEAAATLQKALGMKHDDADALINLITVSAYQGKEDKEISRYQTLLFTAHPAHPYVLEYKEKEAEFDRLAAEYLEKEGIDAETLEKVESS